MSKVIDSNKIIAELNVSRATLNNWVKEGLLVKNNNGIIYSSYLIFKNKHLGKTKLNKRANKLYKDTNANIDITFNYILKYSNKNKIEISDAYEKILNSSYKNREGIFYTPEYTVKEIFNSIKQYTANLEDKIFLDPSCGTGNYILEAIESGIKPNNIYAYDTDNIAIEIARERVYRKTGIKTVNIKCLDFLEYKNSSNIKFDIIATNPPWGKKINKNSSNEDTFALFFRKSIDIASMGAIISMLLPSSLSNILSYKSLREYLLNYSITEIRDYKKIFDGVLERANNYIVKKVDTNINSKTICIIDNKYNDKYSREQKSFSNNPFSIFNFYTSEEEQKIINHIYSYDHKTLYNNATWALGIVTGNNSLYISKNKNGIPIYRGLNISNGIIRETEEYISDKFNELRQVADMSIYKAKEKIVYKFISNNLSFAIDNKKRLFLNSANILIPNKSLGMTNREIVFLLNSDIINFVFKKIFNTHKVLKSNIECLPLFYNFFLKYKNNYTELDLLNYLSLEKIDGVYRIKK